MVFAMGCESVTSYHNLLIIWQIPSVLLHWSANAVTYTIDSQTFNCF
jgi:hypothetical protein